MQPADAITKWGVRANAGNAHNGKVATTLYNHPVRSLHHLPFSLPVAAGRTFFTGRGDWGQGMYTIGDWPSIWPNGSIYANGGVPQAANLSRHLAKVRSDIERLFPDPLADGIVRQATTPWM